MLEFPRATIDGIGEAQDRAASKTMSARCLAFESDQR